ncbi:hypothetical protein [Longirhabdus pacifica]|uniref:hypothetical protein n=1 Tax=Longirhabdus pacifica TaxID=2305227 RepID=UPI0010090065|nr:hypothetical protein [Longirhabdus pacifica]
MKIKKRKIVLGFILFFCLTLGFAVVYSHYNQKDTFTKAYDSLTDPKLPVHIQNANKIIYTSGIDEAKRHDLFQQSEWEMIRNEDTNLNIAPFSSTCGEVHNNDVYRFLDGDTFQYLIQVQFSFNADACSWNIDAEKVYDFVAIALVTENGEPINRQATDADILVYDEEGQLYVLNGAVSDYLAGGAIYTISDRRSLWDRVGSEGIAWFYIDEPSNGNTYYVKSQWLHTWNKTNATLSRFDIHYENQQLVSPIWANETIPNAWSVIDVDQIHFHPEDRD